MSEERKSAFEPPAWAGPALFTVVALALVVFFWWFL